VKFGTFLVEFMIQRGGVGAVLILGLENEF